MTFVTGAMEVELSGVSIRRNRGLSYSLNPAKENGTITIRNASPHHWGAVTLNENAEEREVKLSRGETLKETIEGRATLILENPQALP